jgi:hypothetical protein
VVGVEAVEPYPGGELVPHRSRPGSGDDHRGVEDGDAERQPGRSASDSSAPSPRRTSLTRVEADAGADRRAIEREEDVGRVRLPALGEDSEAGPHLVSNPAVTFTGAGPTREPTVSATVRNCGTETAWIEEARITILAATRMPVCLTQGAGDVPSSKRYPSELPDFPATARQTVRRDLHVEVQPGRLDAGRFVISLPQPVDRYGYQLPESNGALRSPASTPGDPVATGCFRHNLAGMRRVVADRPARLAVPDLLGSEIDEAPVYAVDAARRTGDSRYATRVEDRAVALLLRDGRENLTDFPAGSMQDAERVLSIHPSKAAKHLLWRAEARAHAPKKNSASLDNDSRPR